MTPDAVAAIRVAPPPATPIVEHAQPGDSMTILDAYAKRGYIMIGSSMFKSGHPESEDSAVRQAQDVGADLVLILDRRYTGSVTSNIPITTLTNTNNSDYYRDSDTITTYVPHTIPMFDYGAVYFVKQRFENSVRSAVISTTQNAKNFKSTRAHWSDWSLMGARPSMPIC